MVNATEPGANNQTNPSETAELRGSFETLKIESKDIAKNVDETGDLSNILTQNIYKEQFETAMNKMGLTMDDYLNARSVWSADAAFDENADTKREKVRHSLSNKRDPMSQLLSANFDAVSSEQGKFQKILEDIRNDTEYIQEIPKWQLEMQKRLNMLKEMRLDIEANLRKKEEEGTKDNMDIRSEIKRRVAELTASIQGEKEQCEKLVKAPNLTSHTSDDKGDENARGSGEN
ncbi:hypothetical protein TSMEX_011098 [Taenia solium]